MTFHTTSNDILHDEVSEEHDMFDISVEEISISTEAMLYDLFYRQHGIRRTTQLESPVISSILNVELPKNSIYHYNPESPLLYGPLDNNPWFKDGHGLRHIQHVVEWQHAPIGTVLRRPGSNQQALIMGYRRKHRALKLLRDFFGVSRQPNQLMVINYCMLNQLWRYRPHRFVNFYQFYNLYATIFAYMNTLAKQTDRHQFIEIRLPQLLHPRPIYVNLSKEYALKGTVTTRYITHFKDSDSMLIQHLWMWLGHQREYSVFNKIEERLLDKINLILTDEGRYTVINLGLLNSWRNKQLIVDDSAEEDTFTDEEVDSSKGLPPERLQYRFYKLIDTFIGMRTGVGQTEINAPVYTEADLNTEDTSDIEDDEEAINVNEVTPNTAPTPTKPQDKPINPEKVLDLVEEVVKGKKVEKPKPQPSRKSFNALPDLPGVNPKEESSPTEDEQEEVTLVKADDNDSPVDEYEDVLPETTPTNNPMVDGPLEDAMEQVNAGNMTVRQYQRIAALTEKYKAIESPYTPGASLEEELVVPDEVVSQVNKTIVPDNDWVVDKTMLESTMESVDRTYITKVLRKNILQAVTSIQKAGIIITDVKTEPTSDVTGQTETLVVQVQPIMGTQSTMRIKIPVFDEEGCTLQNGVKYRLRRGRRDLPIRKVSPVKVSLTSYYGKIGVLKSDKKANNLEKFIVNQIQLKSFSGEIMDLAYGNAITQGIVTSSIYTMVARRYKHFVYMSNQGQKYCLFDYRRRGELLDAFKVPEEERVTKLTELETKYQGTLFAVDTDTQTPHLYFISTKDNLVYSSNDNMPPVTMVNFLGIVSTPPLEVAEIKIFSKTIPLGVLLGYYLGLTKLCTMLGVTPRKLFRGQRLNLTENEYAISFSDESWIFDKRDYKAQLILAGFTQYRRHISEYSVQQFEKPDVYIALLRDAGLNMQMENEFVLLKRLFVDDITAQVLKQMNEPTEWIPLLFRAAELLTTMYSRPEINMEDMMIQGYQRIAGQIYSIMVKNIKANMNKRTQAKERFDIPPNLVFNTIMSDPAMIIVDDINPIHNVKEHDNVTFGGDGGRQRRSMVSHTRSYDETDRGVISEATVDSQDVAITTFLSTNPNIKTLYGATSRVSAEEATAAQTLSVSGCLSVGSTQDDPKRVLFTSIQNSHSIAINGSLPPIVRTGYEHVLAHRVDKKFASVAKDDGKVIAVSDYHISIEYNNGTIENIELGSQYGVSTGKVIDNPIVTDFKVGDTVKKGDVVAFNTKFFVRDIFVPGQVLFKLSTYGRTAFIESNDTEEDSCALSAEFGANTVTKTTKVRTLVLPLNDQIYNLVKVGTIVDEDSILCTLVNAVFSDNNMFGDDELETLSQLAQATPKAKYPGLVKRVDITYYGDINNAHETVKKLIIEADKHRSKVAKLMNDGRPQTGEIINSIRIDGTPVPKDSIIIKVYIENEDGVGSGDKFVLGSQLKTVTGRIMEGTNETESGKPIHCIFGYQSVSNRIVNSATLIGTTTTLLKLITKEVIDIYRQSHPKQ